MLDLTLVGREIYKGMVAKIRGLQDEIHDMELADTDGFMYLGWKANYVQVNKVLPTDEFANHLNASCMHTDRDSKF